MPALPTSWYCCPWEEMLVPHGVVVVIVVVVAVAHLSFEFIMEL